METLEAIRTRKSVRKFQNRAIEPEQLVTLFRAAMAGPSALNEQPWQFVAIDDRAIFQRIMQVYPYAGMLKSAPLAILVCGDTRLEKAPGNWVLDCSCSAHALLLAAHALGLGAVWSGVYPEADRMQALAKMLNLPPEVLPLALVAVGYPDGELPAPQDRFQVERIHLNDWKNLCQS